MAQIKRKPQIPPIKIERFLGTNDTQDGEMGLQLGEAVKCLNWRITPNYKLSKVEGYKTFINFGNDKPVRGMWSGRLNNKDIVLIANNGKLYEFERGEISV